MFDAGALISLREIIVNQRQISRLAGFNSMRNESVGCSTRGNKHLETTCVNTYLTEVDKGRRRGGVVDLINTSKVLCKSLNTFLTSIIFCANEIHVKTMKSQFRSGRYNIALPEHRFSCLRLLYSPRYKWLMCFTATVGRCLRGRLSSSQSPCDRRRRRSSVLKTAAEIIDRPTKD